MSSALIPAHSIVSASAMVYDLWDRIPILSAIETGLESYPTFLTPDNYHEKPLDSSAANFADPIAPGDPASGAWGCRGAVVTQLGGKHRCHPPRELRERRCHAGSEGMPG